MFSGIVGVLGIRLESNFRRAQGAFDIEAEDLDPVVVLTLDRLFPGIKLLSLIDVLAASVAAPAR